MIQISTFRFLSELKTFIPDSPAVEFFKMKGFYTMEKLDDREVQAEQAVALIVDYFKAARSLVDFLNRALQPAG